MPTALMERLLARGKEDPDEPVHHRHLYLAARALGDRVGVDDALHRGIVEQLMTIARDASLSERDSAFEALTWLKQSHHAVAGLETLASDPTAPPEVRAAALTALHHLTATDRGDGD
jgi:hypothetical protein